MKKFTRCFQVLAVGLCVHATFSAETVGVFADSDLTKTTIAGDFEGMLRFAAGDVKKALEARNYVVEVRSISELTTSYPHKKIVISLADNPTVKTVLATQKGTAPLGLSPQAYDMQTTATGATTYWVLGHDERGAMYGGLQLAENLHFEGFSKEQKARVTPHLIERGAKLNMAFDRRSPTYAGEHDLETPSIARGIQQAWNIDFWKAWIDQQARNRYNLLTVWNHSPFVALVNVPEFEKSTIDYIQGIKDLPGVPYWEDKSLTLAKRQQFWRDVMKYAKKRGFDFYFFNWNICTEHVEDFYAVKHEDITNTLNKKYLNNAIKELLTSYPDLAGFGVSPGDAMPNVPKRDIAKWVFDAYSKGIEQFAQENRGRKFGFIHRNLKVDSEDVVEFWKGVVANNPNLRFDHSLKYCMAYTYSTETPEWAFRDVRDLTELGQSTYLTLRNDGFFYTDFGDSEFVRSFIKNLPSTKYDGKVILPRDKEENDSDIETPPEHVGKDRLRGVYFGHDTYTPTVSYLFKDQELNTDPVTGKPMLEIQRKWLMEMLWGRIGYDINVTNEVFARGLGLRYPTLATSDYQVLFQAWAKSSQVNTKLMELVQGEWKLDSHFHTEFCMYKDDGEHYFRSLEHFWKGVYKDGQWKKPVPADGAKSDLASIEETGQGNPGKKANDSWKVANLLQKNGEDALTLSSQVLTGGNKRIGALIKSIQTQALLSLYYAHKVRAATYLSLSPQKKTEAKDEMYKAYGWWIHYVNTMDSLYIAEDFRTYEVKNLGWHHWDKDVLKDYQDLGGTGTPNLPALPTPSPVPLITSAATATATLGSPFTYTVTASNAPTSYGAVGLPAGLTINPATGVIAGNFAASGTFRFTVQANNQAGTGALEVTVTVSGTVSNTKPTISNLPDYAVDEDQSVGPVAFTVGDQETSPASLVVSVTSSNETLVPPSSVVFGGSSANRTITITPHSNQHGTATLTVTVSDGVLSAFTLATLTVKAVNDAPTLGTPIPDQNAIVNVPFTYTAPANTFTDVEGTALTWTVTGLPYGITFAAATRTFSGKPTTAGESIVSVTVSDGERTATDAFTINVALTSDQTTIKINFQPESAPRVSGYEVDSGKVFGQRSNGLSYGWTYDMSSSARDRNSAQSLDQLHDTLILTQWNISKPPTWEIAVANGTYNVRIVAGDAARFYDEMHYIFRVEGTVVLNREPTSDKRWVEDTDPIEIKDGRLTLENDASAVRNRINLIELELVPQNPN